MNESDVLRCSFIIRVQHHHRTVEIKLKLRLQSNVLLDLMCYWIQRLTGSGHTSCLHVSIPLFIEDFTVSVNQNQLIKCMFSFEFLIITFRVGLLHLCSFPDVQHKDEVKGLLLPLWSSNNLKPEL